VRRDIVDDVSVFLTHYGVVQALKRGISAPLKVRAEDVVIQSIRRAAIRRLGEPAQEAQLGLRESRRRLTSGRVAVYYEIHNAPESVTPESVVQAANAIKVGVNRQLRDQGLTSYVSDITMDSPVVELRVVDAASMQSTTLEVMKSARSCAGAPGMLPVGFALLLAPLQLVLR